MRDRVGRRRFMVPWYSLMMLGFEANSVIGLRLMKLAAGGDAARKEAELMVSEKMDAAMEAGTTLMSGGSLTRVVDRYRQHVAANQHRLSPASRPHKSAARKRRTKRPRSLTGF